MNVFCDCGRKMKRNGVRTQSVTDVLGERFVEQQAEVHRHRCTVCGTSSRTEWPPIEPGFRLTAAAAEALVAVVIQTGIGDAATRSRIDKATLSRLVAARAAGKLARTVRPSACRIERFAPTAVRVSDAWTDEAVAFFNSEDDERLMPWLSRPFPSVVLPDRHTAPKLLRWKDRLKLCLSAATVADMAEPLFERAARKMAGNAGVSPTARAAMAEALCGFGRAGDPEVDAALRPGTPGRHFIRLKSAFSDALSSADAADAAEGVRRWRRDCANGWEKIFSPVLSMLDTYEGVILTHPVATRAYGAADGDDHASSASANVLTIALP